MIQLTKNNLDIITFNIFKGKALYPSEKEENLNKMDKRYEQARYEKEYKLEILRNMYVQPS